jgi:hypothetical protein
MATLGFQEVILSTPPVTYIERSVGYVYSEALQRVGFSPVPAAKATPKGIPWRALRKAMQLTFVVPTGQLASIAGAGPSIAAIFRKAPLAEGPVRERRD